ncbi:MAG: BLUF domain-containing protein [Vitreoscilla sp.]
MNVIQMDDNLQVRYWVQRLAVSRHALGLAVQMVGNDPAEVERFIRRARGRCSVNGTGAAPDSVAAGGQRRDDARAQSAADGDGGLLRLQYVSRAAADLTADAVQAIVSWSATFNARTHITGALIFTGTHFSQVLEGPPSAVRALMASISRDSRHRDIRMLYESEISKRRFAGWSMALRQDAGLNDLIEELWWAHRIDSVRAARLVQHLLYGLQWEPADERVAKPASDGASGRSPGAAS